MHIYILVLTVPRGLHQMGISAIDISSVMLEIKKNLRTQTYTNVKELIKP